MQQLSRVLNETTGYKQWSRLLILFTKIMNTDIRKFMLRLWPYLHP